MTSVHLTALVLASFTDVGYVAVGWVTTVGVIVAYALHVIIKGRRLSRVVPPEERRWS